MRQVNDHPFTSLFNYCHTIHQNLWRPHQFLILQSEMIALKEPRNDKRCISEQFCIIWNTQDINPNCLQLRTLTAFCLPKLWSNQTKQSFPGCIQGGEVPGVSGLKALRIIRITRIVPCLSLAGMCGVLMDGMDGMWHFRLVCFFFSGKKMMFF